MASLPGEFDLRPRQGRLHGQSPEIVGLSGYGGWYQDFDGYPRDLRIRARTVRIIQVPPGARDLNENQ